MKIYTFFKCFIILVVFIMTLPDSMGQGKISKPNIIILLADDLGYRDLSCYGSVQVYTPNIDKIAANGIRFTDFYAGSAVCSPSRASLLTGRAAVRAGIYSWIHPSHKMHLHRDEVTIAEILKNEGYNTAHIGKWHLSYDLEKGSGPAPGPGDQGFDYWMATANNAQPSHRNPINFVKNGEVLGEITGYSSQIVVDEAISWLNQNKKSDKPFFMNLWFHEPHEFVAAPRELTDRHGETSKPAYYGSIENMDRAIGRLWDHLDNLDVLGNTLVIFMSDNGSYMGDYGSNGELKGVKGQLWEGGIRVPGIVMWKGHIEAGSIDNSPLGVVDILPTICEIVEADNPKHKILDGESFFKILQGEELNRTKPLYWFYSPARPVVAMRQGNWILAANPNIDIPRVNRFEEEWIGMIKSTDLKDFTLYNLRRDPRQLNSNAKEKNVELFNSMKNQLESLHKEIINEAMDWRRFNW